MRASHAPTDKEEFGLVTASSDMHLHPYSLMKAMIVMYIATVMRLKWYQDIRAHWNCVQVGFLMRIAHHKNQDPRILRL